jgi:hypothetical protein
MKSASMSLELNHARLPEAAFLDEQRREMRDQMMKQQIRTLQARLLDLRRKSLDQIGFYGLTREVARLVSASGAAVLLIDDADGRIVHSRALVLDGAPVGNLRFDIRCTPCEFVVGGRELLVPGSLSDRFAEGEMLSAMGLQAYAGVPMRNAEGRVIGLVAAFFREPVEHGDLVLEILRIASRIVAREMAHRLGRSEERPETDGASADTGALGHVPAG